MNIIETVFMALGVAVSLSLLASGLLILFDEWRLKSRLQDMAGQQPASLPASLLPLCSRLLSGSRDRAEIERDLRAAGYFDPQAPLLFAALRVVGALGGGMLTAAGLWASGQWQGSTRLLAVAATGISYVGAKIVLRSIAATRKRQVNAQLPFMLDLMTMMLESGVSLDQCFRTLAGPDGNAAPAIREAMAAMVQDVQHGMPYDQALDRWADRLGVDGARELAGILRQSMFQGTELGGVLREFAREYTEKRVAHARESIGRKTTKMAVVMMLFMMPSLFIVLCGPAIATIVAALSGAKS